METLALNKMMPQKPSGSSFLCGWSRPRVKQQEQSHGVNQQSPRKVEGDDRHTTSHHQESSPARVSSSKKRSSRNSGCKDLYDFWEYESNNGGASQEYLDYILEKYDAYMIGQDQNDGALSTNYEFEHVMRERMKGPYKREKQEFLRQRTCMDGFLKTIEGDEELRDGFEHNCLKENGKLSWWNDVQECPFVMLLHSSVRIHFVDFVRKAQKPVVPPASEKMKDTPQENERKSGDGRVSSPEKSTPDMAAKRNRDQNFTEEPTQSGREKIGRDTIGRRRHISVTPSPSGKDEKREGSPLDYAHQNYHLHTSM